MVFNREIFYIRLNYVLRKNNISSIKLSKELNISIQTIENWRIGKSVPRIGTICQIAELYNVSLEWLLGVK